MQTLAQFIDSGLSDARPQAYAERLGRPEWAYTSSTTMRERAGRIARALRAAGAERGDRVAIVAENSVDWIASAFGIHYAGCVAVPVFSTLALDQLDYILRDSEAKLAFVDTAADAERLAAACSSAPRIVTLAGDGPHALSTFAGSVAPFDPSDSAALARDVGVDDLAVLIYTSGTTGDPKGVMLLNRNIVANAESSGTYLMSYRVSAPDEPVLSVLPFAHIYEHNNLMVYLMRRARVFVTQPDYVLDDLKSARPVTLAFVPRIFERILAGIVGRAKAEGGARARLVPWALGIGRDYTAASIDGKRPPVSLSLPYAIAQRLVLSKIRPMSGLDRTEFISTGSAPLHRDIAFTFSGMGVPICEGYGLTETSPVLTVNLPQANRTGSVGKPIPGVEIKLAEDGEILAKGPNVMAGYYHRPDERPFTDDGWFKTGDIGEFDADGFLFITDRKKELLKSSAGKYIAPGRVESSLRRSIYIGQCFVVGDARPFPIALVCPNWDLVRRELSIDASVTNAALVERSDVRELIGHEVIEKTNDLGSFEQIRRFALLPRDLTIEDGELSPTMKVKRRVVEKKFADLIESAYGRTKVNR